MSTRTHSPITGCLLGTALGDSLGLPTEGMTRSRTRRFHGGSLQHRLILRRGLCSDDTEHTCMLAVALIRQPADPFTFQKALAKSFRWWLAALPAGVGLSTAKAIARLWIGIPPQRAGVFSAGNGAAMRSALLGAAFPQESAKRRSFVQAACLLTHTDPRAIESAVMVAEAAALATQRADTDAILNHLRSLVSTGEMQTRFRQLESSLQERHSVSEYASCIGSETRVSGFAPDTVSVALYAWLRHRGDFRLILAEAIFCGGDTDTVAAIAGGISGCETAEQDMPDTWLSGLCEQPRSTAYLRQLAAALEQAVETGLPSEPPSLPLWQVPFRNLAFLLIVLFHGFRRLIPSIHS